MSLVGKHFKLANGATVPAVAYGAGTKWFKLSDAQVDQSLVKSVKAALDLGFTHIDAAEIYNTDAEIGAAVAGRSRSSYFLTDKYAVGDSTHQNFSKHGDPYNSLKFHLQERLKLDYVDLYLLHSPFISKDHHGFDLQEAWRSLEKLVDDGLAKSIGVSNFAVDDLKKVLEIARIKPVVNQIEFNAFLQDQTPGVVEFSKKNDILVEAYSPLGPISKGNSAELNTYLDSVAAKYNKTQAQVLLRWVIENNILPVTTSSNEERIAQFADIFDFQLTAEEVDAIGAIGKKHKPLRQYWTREYAKFDQ